MSLMTLIVNFSIAPDFAAGAAHFFLDATGFKKCLFQGLNLLEEKIVELANEYYGYVSYCLVVSIGKFISEVGAAVV